MLPVITDALPLIVQVVAADTVTTFVHIIATPVRAPVMVRVKLPAPVEVTETVAAVDEPTIEPLPLIVQEKVFVPPAGAMVAV